ncbi:adenosine deaminase family protein [Aspergillus steynii IBT 23096]|uniref:adenosine deaminase n=1 Tax=Aspergillus steynii IBT 23096 TaxID=1392250 RepID=A0A2I2GAI0_9EURO|nr:adenosine deaminase family protein [Aspergillus steynii IBT 23096]PLB49877.1 adenosine deaminase family protein [Aspergillus steynii IBT 23096]
MRVLGLVSVAFAALSAAQDWSPVLSDNSSIVQKHMLARSNMITLEKRQRQDYEFRQNMSAVARQADALVKAIRQEEIDDYWRHYAELQNHTDERFAGMMFPLARPYIADTKLWQIVKRMPKGALLHAHLTAMLPYEVLLETVVNTEGMVVSASQSLDTPEGRENATIAFSHVNTTVPDGEDITSADYVPNTDVLVADVVDSFPGGKDGFFDFAQTKMEVQPENSIQHELGVDEIWRRFQAMFDPAGTLLTYEPIVRTFYQRLFGRLAGDGINWVEIRAGGSSGKLVHEGDEDPDPDLDVWWTVLQEELEKFQSSEAGENFWGARVIWSDWRGGSTDRIINSMKIALDRKLKFPELFSGYDVVAQEDLGRTLADLAPELLWFQEQAANLNVSVPFFFHAGETLGDGNSTDLNLVDALVFGTRRIGHGFSLYKHPHLIEEVIENGIMVEVCPISNEVLRLATDILHHPLPAMIAHGVPTAISNDDPAMLGQDAAGVSYDFYQVIQGFDNVGLAGLGALAQNSIRWSNFEDQSDDQWIIDIDQGENGDGIKAQRLQQWKQEWEEFCQWVVSEFGSEA